MQLQNKELTVRYTIVLGQDEMNDLILMLDEFNAQYSPTSTQRKVIDSLRDFRGTDGEPCTSIGTSQ